MAFSGNYEKHLGPCQAIACSPFQKRIFLSCGSDGAIRMLVVLYFHTLGYSPFEVAMLFLFYEFFGIVTNLVGGWLGARFGLNRTMQIGRAHV